MDAPDSQPQPHTDLDRGFGVTACSFGSLEFAYIVPSSSFISTSAVLPSASRTV